MSLNWTRSFSDKQLQAPFLIENDADYYDDLRKRLAHFVELLIKAEADDESIVIAQKFSSKVCEALRDYYKGRVASCHQKIENLIKKCDHELAVSELSQSRAFPGARGSEIQFFRARVISEAKRLKACDFLPLPLNLRSKSKNYRFSIPGVGSGYFANSSYGCWIEMGKPSDHDFYVAPIVLDENLKVFNLAVMTRDASQLNDGNAAFVHCWIKLLVLMIATSYIVDEKDRTFHSEYIISQSIMLACKKLGYDGVAYYSKRADEEMFAFAAINLALFADYVKRKKYGRICDHIKVDEPLNYQLFKQLNAAATYQKYMLRVARTNYSTNFNGYKRQYSFFNTDFYRFDEHLFGRWTDKDEIEWGNAVKE